MSADLKTLTFNGRRFLLGNGDARPVELVYSDVSNIYTGSSIVLKLNLMTGAVTGGFTNFNQTIVIRYIPNIKNGIHTFPRNNTSVIKR